MKFSINSIALSNIKNRKEQYIMLFVGIALSIYFTATALLFGYSTFTSIKDLKATRLGYQNTIIKDCRDVSFEELKQSGIFSEYGYSKMLAVVLPTGKVEDGGFNVSSYDETALKLENKSLIEGRLPENEGEIALEESAVKLLKQEIKTGDTLTLTIMAPGLNNEDGTPYTVEKQYTLVGILKNQAKYQEIFMEADSFDFNLASSGMFSTKEQAEAGSLPTVKCHAVMTINEENRKTIIDFLTTNGIMKPKSEIMDQIQYYDLAYSFSDGASNIISDMMTFCIVIAIVLVVASCLGIANAFSSMLDVRKYQIGLLRAVGATKKQIRTLFSRESIIIALLSIPFALILSCLTVFGITKLLGENYTFNLNLLMLLPIAGFGLLVVMTACALPLRNAAAISPMQAIRRADLSRQLKNKSIKSKSIFDVSKLIANRNITLYKSKMLSVSLVLLIAVAFFSIISCLVVPDVVAMLGDSGTTKGEYAIAENSNYKEGYGITQFIGYFGGDGWNWLMEQKYHAPGITEQDKRDVENLVGVDRASGMKATRIKLLTDRITPYITTYSSYNGFYYLAPELAAESDESKMEPNPDYDKYLASKTKYGYDDFLTVNMIGFDDDLIKKLSPFVIDGRIDIDKLNSGEEILIVAPKEYSFKYTVLPEGGGMINLKYNSFTGDDVVVKNDMFFAGNEIDISLLYTDGIIESAIEDAEINFPEGVVREDHKVKIGAVLAPEIVGVNTKRFDDFVSRGGIWIDLISAVTTNDGLAALGIDLPYKSFMIHTAKNVDAETRKQLEVGLNRIAARTPGVEKASYISVEKEYREANIRIFVGIIAVIILLLVICVSILNNAISARIRSDKREIGTLRAVGASKAEVKKSYFWQLLSMFGIGSTLGIISGVVVIIAISAITGLKSSLLPLWQTMIFILFVFGISYANIDNRVNGILKNNVVENIREL